MSENLPVKITEILKLTSFNIPPTNISFAYTSMESEKFICVRVEDPRTQEKMITVVDTSAQKASTHKINAESAIINPESKVVALRAGTELQVINLEMKSKMKDFSFKEDSNVSFWKWLSSKTIGLVTEKAVFLWSMEGSSNPKRLFDRHENLLGSVIINFRSDPSEQWLILCGLTKVGQDMKGVMQLYSVEKNVTQFIEGHAACFLQFKMPGGKSASVIAITVNNPEGGGKLSVMELPNKNPAGFQKYQVPIQFVQGDFPVAMQANEKLGILYILTLKGGLYLFDVEQGIQICISRVSQETIFVTAPVESTHGFVGINNKVGQLLSVSVDETKIIPYLNSQKNIELAIKIASRGEIQDSSITDLFLAQFNQLLNLGKVDEAVKLAANSPILRTTQTIQRLQRIAPGPNQKPPISLYFQYILETGKLNKLETIELAKVVLQKGGTAYVKQQLEAGKMEASEELGDLVRQSDQELAMHIYLMGKCHEKIIESLILAGDPKRVFAYCDKVSYEPNYVDVFKKFVYANPDASVEYATTMYGKGKLDANLVADIYVQNQKFKHVTAFFLEILQGDKAADGALQTRLLEINLMYSPPAVADNILGKELFSHYDKRYIAQLCERANLVHRALENYSDLEDIKKCLVNAAALDVEWATKWFGTLDSDIQLQLLNHLMKLNMRANMNLVVAVATKNVEKIGTSPLIQLFDSFKCYPGLFYFLAAIVDYSEDPEVHFKYIEAGVRTEQWTEVERVTRKSDFYDPRRTKDFLKENKLADLTPLINVCDKYDYIEELIRYLFSIQQMKYVEGYVKQRPLKAPLVIGALLAIDASEDYIKALLAGVGPACPIEPLVVEVEKRNRLKILLQWLEARVAEGSQEPAAHNALAKIYIDLHTNADKFLETNNSYDFKLIGKYCEKRDPNLALIAFRRGQCDIELIDLTNAQSMFKQQAKYLVKRQNPQAWSYVLNEENKFRRQLIDAVVQTALQETSVAEEVSSTVKAFMAADLPNELIELLEKIVLYGNKEFKNNKNLQNLLLLTSIKANREKVIEYVKKLDNFDGVDIAKIAIQNQLFEEAYEIYKKFKYVTNAARVLIENIGDLQRAQVFAETLPPTAQETAEVFSLLGRAQLSKGFVVKAIESFMKANDPSVYQDVIQIAEQSDSFEELIVYLRMARKKIQDAIVDTELVYAFAKLSIQKPSSSALTDLEDFILSTNMARIQEVGDRCFQESIFEAARILFQSINNYACLASCFVKLNRLREAVTAATKANTPKSWKEVLYACVDALDFKNAQVCALNLIMDSDELDHITTYYESRGHFEQLIKLLEKGLQQENPNMGICTSLGIAYCKYQPEKLMDHITKYYKRISINRLLSHCSTNELYPEMRFLYSVSDEHDNAIKLMIEHPAECYDANAFGDSITKVLSTELCYRAIQFYVEFYPSKLNDLLGTISQKVDHERIAQDAKADGSLPLFKKHFQNIQELNLAKVNDALNQLYVDEEDYDKLRESIKHDNFNQLALAKQLESHPLLEFRRISAHLFRVNKNFAASIDISKKDNLYRDAIDTAALSKDSKIAEDLLRFFISKQKKECFAACLFTCYEIIRPDVGLELAWRFGYQDMAMPFLIQVLREYTTKVNELYADKQKADELRKQLERQPGSELVVDQGSFMGSDVAGMIPGMIPGNMSGFIPGVGVGGFSQGMMDPSMFNNGVVQQYGNHF